MVYSLGLINGNGVGDIDGNGIVNEADHVKRDCHLYWKRRTTFFSQR